MFSREMTPGIKSATGRPSYLAASMACPGDVEVRYSIHSRLSVDVMVTGNREGTLEPHNRAAQHTIISVLSFDPKRKP